MYNPDTDFIFPPRVLPDIRSLRGPEWEELVDHVRQLKDTDPDRLAFVLMMVGLNGCQTCNADSFKAMRGCTACSVQTLERYSGTDASLKTKFEKALKKIQNHIDSIQKVE